MRACDLNLLEHNARKRNDTKLYRSKVTVKVEIARKDAKRATRPRTKVKQTIGIRYCMCQTIGYV